MLGAIYPIVEGHGEQPAFISFFDLRQARAVPSFDKLWRDLARLFGEPAS